MNDSTRLAILRIGIFLGVLFLARWLTVGLHSAAVTGAFVVVGIFSLVPALVFFVHISKKGPAATGLAKTLRLLPIILLASVIPGIVIGLLYHWLYGGAPGLADAAGTLDVVLRMTLAALALSVGIFIGGYIYARPAKTRLGRALRFSGALFVAMVMAGIGVGLISRFL